MFVGAGSLVLMSLVFFVIGSCVVFAFCMWLLVKIERNNDYYAYQEYSGKNLIMVKLI